MLAFFRLERTDSVIMRIVDLVSFSTIPRRADDLAFLGKAS
jgi:hypothetical protein